MDPTRYRSRTYITAASGGQPITAGARATSVTHRSGRRGGESYKKSAESEAVVVGYHIKSRQPLRFHRQGIVPFFDGSKDSATTHSDQLASIALTLAKRAFPCALCPPTAQKPVMPSCLQQIFTASIHFFKGLLAKFFLARREAFLLTILPALDFIRPAAVIPLAVLAFLPLKTAARAYLPLAMMLTRLAFMIRPFFITPAFFMGLAPFMAAFFIGLVFIARAMADDKELLIANNTGNLDRKSLSQ